jgi:membrane protein YdbS with pleckstrin-like domain
MSEAELRPDKRLRTLWLTQWAVATLVVLLPFLLPMLGTSRSAVADMLGGTVVLWLILALPVGLWIPFYFRSLSVELNNAELKQNRGVLNRKTVLVPLSRIVSVSIHSGPLERLFRLERLKIYTEDQPAGPVRRPTVTLPGLVDAQSFGRLLLGSDSSFGDALQAAKDSTSGSPQEMLRTLLAEVRQLREEVRR